MIWKLEAYKILSKFFVGYGAGFSAIVGYGATVHTTDIIINAFLYSLLSGLVTVFPQLTKTFAEASRK